MKNDDTNCGIMNKLQILQNTMMRVILGVKREDRVTVSELLSETGYKSVNQMVVQHTLNETFNIVHHNSIPDVRKCLTEHKGTERTTRSKSRADLIVHVAKKSRNRGFLEQAARIWNSVPSEMRETSTKVTFKHKIHPYIGSCPI